MPGRTEVRLRQFIGIEATQVALEDVHGNVADQNAASRAKAVLRHNAKTKVQNRHFEIGYLVLVRRARNKVQKLHFVRRGPRRVTAVKCHWFFQVENSLKHKKEAVHSRPLVGYRCGLDGKEVDPILLRFAKHSKMTYQDAFALKFIRKEKDGLQMLVEWKGLPDIVDQTWEPTEQVFKELTGLLGDFLHTFGKHDLKQKALGPAFLSKAN